MEYLRRVNEMMLEMPLIVFLIFLSIVPHELAHVLVFKYYGVDTHLKIDRVVCGRMKSFAICVIPNDESLIDNLSRKNIGIVAASGGIASTIFSIVCYLLLGPFLTTPGNIFLMLFIGYNVLYTIWETRLNLNLN